MSDYGGDSNNYISYTNSITNTPLKPRYKS